MCLHVFHHAALHILPSNSSRSRTHGLHAVQSGNNWVRRCQEGLQTTEAVALEIFQGNDEGDIRCWAVSPNSGEARASSLSLRHLHLLVSTLPSSIDLPDHVLSIDTR